MPMFVTMMMMMIMMMMVRQLRFDMCRLREVSGIAGARFGALLAVMV